MSAASLPAPRERSAWRRAPRLLLIEDDEALRHYLTGELRRDGFEVTALADGAQVLDLIVLVEEAGAQPLKPDVVVTDLRLPGCADLEVLVSLRRTAGWTVPIVAMTAFASDADRARARQLGADLVFGKPFELDDLRTALRTVIDHPPSGARAAVRQ